MARPDRYAIWLLMMLILVMSPTSLLAQEETETPSPPTATFTPTATASPTETSTSTVTATATVTNTATSTTTETATNTATATELATGTDAPTETLAPSPELTAEVTESATEPAIEVTAELTESATEPATEVTAELTESATEPGIEMTEELTPEVTAEVTEEFSLSPELTDVVNEETVITESNLYLPTTSELNIVTSSDEMSPPDINQLLSMETTLQANALIVSSNVSSTNYLEDFENAPGSFTYPTIANVASNGGNCYCDPPVSPALSSRGILARNFVAQPFGTFMWINVDVLLPEISRVTAADFDAAYDIFPITGTTLNALEIIFWDENDAIVEIKSCSYTTPSNICSIDFGDPVDNVRVVRFRHTYVGFINNSVDRMDISVDNLSLSHEPMPNVIFVDDPGTMAATTAQSISSFDSSFAIDNGICSIFEAIETGNGNPPNEDCKPEGYDASNVGEFVVSVFPYTYVFTGQEDITGDIIIRPNIPGTFATITRLDGLSSGNHRLFEVMPGGKLTLENIIVSNGRAVANPPDTTPRNGGAILNAGTLILSNSAIIGNYASGNGGGIYNTGEMDIQDSIVQQNGAFNQGGAIYNNSSQNSMINTSCIASNLGGLDRSSVVGVSSITATGNWWGASNGPRINNVGNGDTIMGSVVWDPQNPTAQTNSNLPCITNPVRVVSPEAQTFHNNWLTYGLPMPFDRLPFNIQQPGQQPDDPLGWTAGTNQYRQYIQGFGPSSFAWGHRTLYNPTFQIHSGVDYGSGGANPNAWDDRVIVSLCDGVIITGNGYSSSGFPTGGSAGPGRGVSVRCFASNLDTIWVDTDVDGNPNLSNLVVTYNHLNWQRDDPSTPDVDERFYNYGTPPTISCNLLSDITCTGVYELPVEGDIVRIGQTLGQTGADPTFDHLHMSVFLARGFARASVSENTFYLNPMLMYTSDIVEMHYFQSYFPYILGLNDTVSGPDILEDSEGNPLGIASTDIRKFAAGGWNSQPDGDSTTNTFWAVQELVPEGPNNVEWSTDNYPLLPANDGGVITDIIEYLNQSVASFPYVYPNCTLAIDTTRTPARDTANCDLSDLDDESSYTAIQHPTP